ncbi:MAG: 23S rRNA (uridine(2552)-2'-O-)-methyltransferase [Amphiamblys sp. WSBS2006]|nr:MAG: 23S rRNA (uridine(2552)-2'-O-)-methyltransferase [Amphiamblys sp. WSBS2006]
MSRNRTTDPFYAQAKKEAYRARSAFKLLEIEKVFCVFDRVDTVVDLCAAPGSWSQVLRESLPKATVVAVDIQKMAPIEGVTVLLQDITKPEAVEVIEKNLPNSLAGLVVCDGAPDVSGLHDLDEFLQEDILQNAFRIAKGVLCRGGSFVAKIFCKDGKTSIQNDFIAFFEKVSVFKPESSRKHSREHFLVCETYLKEERR